MLKNLGKKKSQEKIKKINLNKYFIEDDEKLESKFDLKQKKEKEEMNHIEELTFNQIDDDEPERSSDDEYEGKLPFF